MLKNNFDIVKTKDKSIYIYSKRTDEEVAYIDLIDKILYINNDIKRRFNYIVRVLKETYYNYDVKYYEIEDNKYEKRIK